MVPPQVYANVTENRVWPSLLNVVIEPAGRSGCQELALGAWESFGGFLQMGKTTRTSFPLFIMLLGPQLLLGNGGESFDLS